jgi:hypothetical protein
MYPAPWKTRDLAHAHSSSFSPPPNPLIYGFEQLCTNIQNISNSSYDKHVSVDHEKVSAKPVTDYITVIPRLTKIIRSGITFFSRNVISRRFL